MKNTHNTPQAHGSNKIGASRLGSKVRKGFLLAMAAGGMLSAEGQVPPQATTQETVEKAKYDKATAANAKLIQRITTINTDIKPVIEELRKLFPEIAYNENKPEDFLKAVMPKMTEEKIITVTQHLNEINKKMKEELSEIPGIPENFYTEDGNITPEALEFFKNNIPEEHKEKLEELRKLNEELKNVDKNDTWSIAWILLAISVAINVILMLLVGGGAMGLIKLGKFKAGELGKGATEGLITGGWKILFGKKEKLTPATLSNGVTVSNVPAHLSEALSKISKEVWGKITFDKHGNLKYLQLFPSESRDAEETTSLKGLLEFGLKVNSDKLDLSEIDMLTCNHGPTITQLDTRQQTPLPHDIIEHLDALGATNLREPIKLGEYEDLESLKIYGSDNDKTIAQFEESVHCLVRYKMKDGELEEITDTDKQKLVRVHGRNKVGYFMGYLVLLESAEEIAKRIGDKRLQEKREEAERLQTEATAAEAEKLKKQQEAAEEGLEFQDNGLYAVRFEGLGQDGIDWVVNNMNLDTARELKKIGPDPWVHIVFGEDGELEYIESDEDSTLSKEAYDFLFERHLKHGTVSPGNITHLKAEKYGKNLLISYLQTTQKQVIIPSKMEELKYLDAPNLQSSLSFKDFPKLETVNDGYENVTIVGYTAKKEWDGNKFVDIPEAERVVIDEENRDQYGYCQGEIIKLGNKEIRGEKLLTISGTSIKNVPPVFAEEIRRCLGVEGIQEIEFDEDGNLAYIEAKTERYPYSIRKILEKNGAPRSLIFDKLPEIISYSRKVKKEDKEAPTVDEELGIYTTSNEVNKDLAPVLKVVGGNNILLLHFLEFEKLTHVRINDKLEKIIGYVCEGVTISAENRNEFGYSHGKIVKIKPENTDTEEAQTSVRGSLLDILKKRANLGEK